MTKAAAVGARDDPQREDPSNPRFFFIVGCPRSGTTLLRVMLDAHPSIAVTPETHFATRYLSKPDGETDAQGVGGANASAALDGFVQSLAFKQMSIDEECFRERVRLRRADRWDPLRVALEEFARINHTPIVGEKTPSHTFHIEALASAFPDAQFLMLTRDPRAVVSSWLDATWSYHSATKIAEIWCRHSRAIRRATRRIGHRCRAISYEELITNPTSVLSSACEFLGSRFDSRMLVYHDRRRDTMSAAAQIDHALTFERPKPERIDAWRKELSAADLRRVEAICARPMRRSGYSPVTSIHERVPAMMISLPSIWRKRIKRRLRA